MPQANPFANPAFGLIQMVMAINRAPNQYGKVSQAGIFPNHGVATESVLIDERNGVLNLLPSVPRGAPPTAAEHATRTARSLPIPHIPHEDIVLPKDVQGVRAFGSENQAETVAQKVAERLAAMRAKHDQTLEYLRVGALKGLVLDADGSTLADLFQEFGKAQKTIDFVLSNPATDVAAKVRELKRYVEDNLLGEVSNGIHVYTSEQWFDAFIAHDGVKAAYERWNGSQFFRDDQRAGFPFQGVTFEEYRGKATLRDGTVRKFIADDEAQAFPTGTSTTFRTYFAPGSFNETANTIGLELYAKQEARKWGRGMDLYSESNPLPICHRPETLVRLITS